MLQCLTSEESWGIVAEHAVHRCSKRQEDGTADVLCLTKFCGKNSCAMGLCARVIRGDKKREICHSR